MKINWPETIEPPPLAAGEVHVWTVSLMDVRMPWPDLERMLSGEESARAGRFLREEAGRAFATGRVALRSILGKYLQTPAADVPIENAPNGKPQLTSAITSDVRFNLAHSGELALVAVTHSGEIGVDVECLRPVDHWQEIASRYFHDAETAAIGANSAQTPEKFFRCWTRKEAVLKAIGVGIIFPLDMFQVPLDEPTRNWVDMPAHSAIPAARYWLESLDPATGYVAAVATTLQITQAKGFTYRIRR